MRGGVDCSITHIHIYNKYTIQKDELYTYCHIEPDQNGAQTSLSKRTSTLLLLVADLAYPSSQLCHACLLQLPLQL